MKYFFRVTYDGARFAGWQNQPNGISVQELLEEALTIVLRVPCCVVGAGRTDAGVHARAQGAHFEIGANAGDNDVADDDVINNNVINNNVINNNDDNNVINNNVINNNDDNNVVNNNIINNDNNIAINTTKLTASLNAILPHDIAVYDMVRVPQNFHARFSACARVYNYYITTRKNPLMHKRAWALYHHIDWARVENETATLRGAHDFTAFCSSKTDAKNMICDIEFMNVATYENEKIITIKANRFLYKMVRSLVGTLVDIGRGRLDDTLLDILASKDRNRAGVTAPAHGLVLEDVIYPPDCFCIG